MVVYGARKGGGYSSGFGGRCVGAVAAAAAAAGAGRYGFGAGCAGMDPAMEYPAMGAEGGAGGGWVVA